MKSFRLRNGELVLPSQRITPGTSTLVIRLGDHELSDDGDGGDGGGDVSDCKAAQMLMMIGEYVVQ